MPIVVWFVTILEQMDFFGNSALFDKYLSIEFIGPYLEIAMTTLMSWVLIPFWTFLILPTFVLLLVYLTAFFVIGYGKLYGLKRDFKLAAWDTALKVVAIVWYMHGRLWHGYEIEGIENIPSKGPALLVYYHGALPIDQYYFLAAFYLKKKRQIRPFGDRFLYMIPGWEMLMCLLKVITGPAKACTDVLRSGEILSIAPGGVLEAQFSDQQYELLWGKRIGFAKVAIEAKAPIIPLFTENIREAFRSVVVGKSFMQRLYMKMRIPVVPIFGGFPVKLRTIVGKPIPYDPSISAEDLAVKTAEEIQKLIAVNQRIPGSVIHGLLERFTSKKTMKVQ